MEPVLLNAQDALARTILIEADRVLSHVEAVTGTAAQSRWRRIWGGLDFLSILSTIFVPMIRPRQALRQLCASIAQRRIDLFLRQVLGFS